MAGNLLIVIDMLNDFIDERGALYCGESARAIVPFIQKRIDTYRRNGEPVIYLQDSHDRDDKEFERFPAHCVRGTWGQAVIAELAPLASETVIAKKRFSGFFRTELDRVLTAGSPKTIEVVGVCTSICVMDTVGGLASRDYDVILPLQGIADLDPEQHAFAVKRMQTLYGARIK